MTRMEFLVPIVLVAIGMYLLYVVIRAGVRDGIKAARQSEDS
jgi:hypothetical protein